MRRSEGLARREFAGGLVGVLAGLVLPAAFGGEGGPTGRAPAFASAGSGVDGTSDPVGPASAAALVGDALPVSFVDDLGRAVDVASADRVVACMGSLARLWELAGGALAGVSADAPASYPELDLPDGIEFVGDFASLSLERIIALEPTLVLLSAASGGRGRGQAASQVQVGEALADLGIPVAFFKVTTFADYLRALRTCCSLTGCAERYGTYGDEVAARVDEVVASVPAEAAPPRVALLVTYSGGMRVQDSSTMAGAMLADLGAVNIADEAPGLLSDYSAEALLACDPDVVLVVPMGDDEEAARRALAAQTEEDPAWSALSAVREGRCHLLGAAGFLYKPLDRWDESYRELYGYLYGEEDGAVALAGASAVGGVPDADR